jgi:hypothetical protein
MKEVLKMIIIPVLIIFSFHANSQEIAFGLKGGVNLSSLSIDDPDASYDSRTGFHAGLFLRNKFDKVAIQPELLLFTQNGAIKSSVLGTAQESFTYLSIPFLFKFYPVLGLNLQAGPQFGFLLDGERKFDNGLFDGKEDIKDHYKSSDIAVSFGAGYDFTFGLGIDVRYNLGIKDINDAANGEPVNSRVFLVSLGWNFLPR